MDLLAALITVSEKAANIARLCRQDEHLFELLVQKKSTAEANPRFIDDFKTLADVLIQELVKHDVGMEFPELVESIQGEENNTFSNTLGETIKVEIEENCEKTADLLKIVLNGDAKAAELLAREVHRKIFLDEVNTDRKPIGEFDINLRDIGIWIDPIDSTAEYISGGEETDITQTISKSGLKCVTVLIGAYDKRSALPVIGIINQPFAEFDGDRWRGHCYWGHPTATSIPSSLPSSNTICVSSSESPEVITKLKDAGFLIIEASGAGYKILLVITGQADAYLLTKDSTFKWDTCAPQAILRALGGDIVIYQEAIKNNTLPLQYLRETCNKGGIIACRNFEILKKINQLGL